MANERYVKRSEIRLRDEISPQFIDVYRKMFCGPHKEGHFLLGGGRGSGKSSFASICLLLRLMTRRNEDAIVFRKVGVTLRESVVQQITWAAKRLGVTVQYRQTYSEFELVDTGQRILLRGVDDPAKSKGIKSARKGFGFVWFEELSEFSSLDEIMTVLQSVLRGVNPICVYTYNPPRDPSSWVNRLSYDSLPRLMIHRSCYREMPPGWLSRAFIDQAETLRESDETSYRHVYLGESVGYPGKIFNNVEVTEISADTLGRFDKFVSGLDFGYAIDPDAYVRAAYEGGRLYIVAEVYANRMSVQELAERVKAARGKTSEPIICDSAAPRMIDGLQGYNLRAVAAKKGNGSVEHGIRWLMSLERIVIDRRRCPNAAREFTEYASLTDLRGKILCEFPDRNNHTIDALRYAVESLSTKRSAVTLSV